MAKTLDNLTVQKAVARLEKTRKSIAAHVERGESPNTARAYELAGRYDDLKSWLLEHDSKAWFKYCMDHNACQTHGGEDMFA